MALLWYVSPKRVTAPLASCLTLLIAPLQCLCCTAYSIFTPVMVFLSGLLIDKIGAKKCAPLFTRVRVWRRVLCASRALRLPSGRVMQLTGK